jgi:hypothetical protein
MKHRNNYPVMLLFKAKTWRAANQALRPIELSIDLRVGGS